MFSYPKLIAHRGASDIAPENTLEAFQLAYDLGAKAIEFDVMLSQDNVPIIIHDNDLKRTTGVDHAVKDLTAKEILTLNAGGWKKNPNYLNALVPSLSDGLAFLKSQNMEANIEIKPYTDPDANEKETQALNKLTAAVVLEALNVANKKKPLPGIVLSSFNEDVLSYLALQAPSWPRGLLLSKWPVDLEALLAKLKPESVNISLSLATAKHVKFLKERGYQVLVYTVNDRKKAEGLFDKGVDGVFSDKADLLN